jgi:lipase chaperone LimK
VLLALVVTLVMLKEDGGQEESAGDSQKSAGINFDISPASNSFSDEGLSVEDQKTVPSDAVLPYKSKFGPLPGSLEGTIMRQSLALDEDGNLRISADVQRIFDFFLSTIEQEDLSVILQRIQEYLDFHLDEPALSQSLAVMNQYVAFKKALFDFEVQRSESLRALTDSPGGLSGETYIALLEEQLQAQKDLRNLHLDPQVHEAFYEDEEIYDDYSLARMKVQADKTLSASEKQDRLAEIDAQAPSELVESRKEAQLTDILKEKTNALKESGASASEIKALRTEMLGVEAAERFEALDQERARWQQRLDQYLAQRRIILSADGLSEQEKILQINQLRQSQFDEREQIRVTVYEKRADAVE